ncbi:MAG: hypothetical protein EOO78_19835, partial [Oxalobacteraceae bacterium]
MGGVPARQQSGELTASSRRHASPEMGTRSARRLLATMLPAWPLDKSDPASPQYDPAARGKLRLRCLSSDPNCPSSCDPTTTNCPLVPLATVFLSDEEDFFFKDDCAYDAAGHSPVAGQSFADKQQLPVGCRYVDGDPNTVEPCTAPYCASFRTEPPQGYSPDQTSMTADGAFSLAWRDAAAPQCAATAPASSCLGDPCPLLGAADCAATPQCVYNPAYEDGAGSVGGCISRCALHVAKTNPTASQAAAQQQRCVADPLCRWDASQVVPGYQDPFFSPPGPCVSKVLHNDCQSCKRFLRTQQALQGDAVLPGFAQVGGPVYAMVRNKGQPGSGTFAGASVDSCGGGQVSWGRGDGQAYRDLAAATLGRTQDVCAPSFEGFMQQLTADLAVVSRPYPLAAQPIAATLQVRLARPVGQGWTTIAVPRSNTRGFFYSATGNTLGFKSDPIDGQCAPGAGCAADASIDAAEIAYARSLPTVPRQGDLIYVSYRLWEPVPCGGMCQPDESCESLVCTAPTSSTSCSAGDDSLCPPGSSCGPDNSCARSCTLGTLIDACVLTANC